MDAWGFNGGQGVLFECPIHDDQFCLRKGQQGSEQVIDTGCFMINRDNDRDHSTTTALARLRHRHRRDAPNQDQEGAAAVWRAFRFPFRA